MNVAIIGAYDLVEEIESLLKKNDFRHLNTDIISVDKFINTDAKIIYKYDLLYINICKREEDIIKKLEDLYTYSFENHIILISNDIRMAVKGYEVGAFRYLIYNNNINEQIKKSILDLKKIGFRKDGFVLIDQNKKIKIEDIVYAESDLHKINLYVLNKNDIVRINGKLDEFENKIKHYGFIRIHKSYLVNRKYISAVERYKVILCVYNNMELPIPKDRYKEVRVEYSAFFEKNCI